MYNDFYLRYELDKESSVWKQMIEVGYDRSL